MFYSNRFSQDAQNDLATTLDIPFLFRHRHSTKSFLKNYRTMAKKAAASKLNGLREIAPSLFRLATDEKTLQSSFTHLRDTGSHAPGPDEMRYELIEAAGVWPWCREMRDLIRSGDYAPSAEYVKKTSKGSGRGFRELTIQSIEDRIVARGIVEILQPLVDPLFLPHSFGYRPKKNPLLALATAEHIAKTTERNVWVSADIRNAFPSVPLNRLSAILKKYTPDETWNTFLDTVIRSDKTPGLRQGSPLSPLLLNLYLHETLDRKWQDKNPHIPLLRYADDILLLCTTQMQARAAYHDLVEMLRPAGFQLKEGQNDAVKSLKKGQCLTWMGFAIASTPTCLQYGVTDRAWDNLYDDLELARDKPFAPIRALHTVSAWVNCKGPCYQSMKMNTTYKRVREIATSHGFNEIQNQGELTEQWQLAHARWRRLQNSIGEE